MQLLIKDNQTCWKNSIWSDKWHK